MIEVKENHNIHSYRFTVESKNDPNLKALKDEVRAHNARVRAATRRIGKLVEKPTQWGGTQEVPYWGRLKRVKLEARGPRAIHARADFGPNGSRGYDCSLPHRYATHFDVYVHTDHTAEYWFKREIKEGKSPSELKKEDIKNRNRWWMDMYTEGRIDRETLLRYIKEI